MAEAALRPRAGSCTSLLALVDMFSSLHVVTSPCCRADNDRELAELDALRKEKEEKYGEIEVLDAINAKADFFSRIGDKVSRVLPAWVSSA